jgi:short-subunit dehydrogenase
MVVIGASYGFGEAISEISAIRGQNLRLTDDGFHNLRHSSFVIRRPSPAQ